MVVILSLLFSVSLLAIVATGQLIPQFYTNTCPNALNIIRTAVDTAVANEARMGASLLRLHFHDCFVNGCDASILLDATATMESEKTAPPNHNSVRGFDVVEDIKSKLEAVCPQTVSCADILAVAARDSVVALGGPSWDLELGRRDSLTAYKDGTVEIPGPASNASGLATAFAAKGLSLEEMVALSGAHTIGEARCTLFRSRLYNESWDMDPALAESLKLNCPMSGVDDSVSTLDSATPNLFDNYYFKNLVARKGLLHSDQQLFGKGYYSVDAQVILYANDEGIFRGDFSAAMLKMSRLSPLTGWDGQVRLRCNKVELRQPAGPARVCSGGSRSSPLVVCLVLLCLLNYYVVIN